MCMYIRHISRPRMHFILFYFLETAVHVIHEFMEMLGEKSDSNFIKCNGGYLCPFSTFTYT